MKLLFYNFLITIFFHFSISYIQADPIEDLEKNLSNNDPSIRASAMEHFIDTLGTADGQIYINKSIPILVSSLKDSNSQVQLPALRGLTMITVNTTPALISWPSDAPTVAGYGPAQEAILNLTASPDTMIRQLALEVYAFNYKGTPDLENKIIAEFSAPEVGDQSGPANRSALLESIIVSQYLSPSAQVTEFLSRLLDDPKWDEDIANRIGIDDVPLTDAILYKLASKLSKEQDASKEAEFARAMSSYGTRAQPYLPQLEALLAKETDENAKFNLQAAIDKIKDPEHHLSRIEQMRKALADRNTQSQVPQPSTNPTSVASSNLTPPPQEVPASDTGIPLWIYGIIMLSLGLIVGVWYLLQSKK